MRNVTVTMNARLALILINNLSVCVKRLEDQMADPTHPPVFVPGFGKPYNFESAETSASILEELGKLRSDLFDGSIDEATRRQLGDLDDFGTFLK